MKGDALIDELKRKFDVQKDSELVKILGGTQSGVSQLGKSGEISPKNISGMIARSRDLSRESYSNECIQTIVEFFPVSRVKSKQGKKFEILNQKEERDRNIKSVLEKCIGIYSYYDSKGEIIYVGKTKNNLWLEMNNAYNRRRAAHTIWQVDHPIANKKADKVGDVHRKITKRNAYLYDTAAYFSAYTIDRLLVDKLEALLIRMLPNDLTNYRIEGQTTPSVD